MSSIARDGEAILARNAGSTSHSSKTTVSGSVALIRRIDPAYGPNAGSALAGSSHGAGPSIGYTIGSNGPLVGGAVGKVSVLMGPASWLLSGDPDGAGPPQPTSATIAAMPADSSRLGRGRVRDIAS